MSAFFAQLTLYIILIITPLVFLPPLKLLKEFEYHYSNQRIKRVYKGNIKEEVNEEGNPFKYKQFFEYLSS